MIILYSGTPGSGKSLHQARDIYRWLSVGKPAITNYEINTSVIKSNRLGDFLYLPNDKLKPKFLIQYSREYFKNHRFKEGAIRVYIDEAQLMFNAREWQISGRDEWISFFTQHRKYGYDVYLIAQFDRMIDRQVRSLIEYEVIHRKCSNFGIYGKILSLFTLGNLFVSVKMWYPLKERVGSEFFKYHNKYSKIYDTYKDFGVFVDNDEIQCSQSASGDKPASTFRSVPAPITDEIRKKLYLQLAICTKQIIIKKSLNK